MRRSLRAGLLLVLGYALPLLAQERAPEIEAVRERELRADLFFLAGDGFRGRLTDTPENRYAGEPAGGGLHQGPVRAAGIGAGGAQPVVLRAFQPDDRHPGA